MYQMMRTFGTGLKLSKSFENSFFFARCSGVTDKKCSIYIYYDDDDASKLREKSL